MGKIKQADIKQGQGGGGERHGVFKIRCILMTSSCLINDDLCRLQIEYSLEPEKERETLLFSAP